MIKTGYCGRRPNPCCRDIHRLAAESQDKLVAHGYLTFYSPLGDMAGRVLRHKPTSERPAQNLKDGLQSDMATGGHRLCVRSSKLGTGVIRVRIP